MTDQAVILGERAMKTWMALDARYVGFEDVWFAMGSEGDLSPVIRESILQSLQDRYWQRLAKEVLAGRMGAP